MRLFVIFVKLSEPKRLQHDFPNFQWAHLRSISEIGRNNKIMREYETALYYSTHEYATFQFLHPYFSELRYSLIAFLFLILKSYVKQCIATTTISYCRMIVWEYLYCWIWHATIKHQFHPGYQNSRTLVRYSFHCKFSGFFPH